MRDLIMIINNSANSYVVLPEIPEAVQPLADDQSHQRLALQRAQLDRRVQTYPPVYSEKSHSRESYLRAFKKYYLDQFAPQDHNYSQQNKENFFFH